jgi:hypothetical protein
MSRDKKFDCAKFKYELQKNLLKASGARSLLEYVNYVNTAAPKSPLHKPLVLE